ncbi:hypothetical protein KQ909_10265, partial [Bacteroides stercoris]|uniref:hypothetical protein n=1 Tax=Bacteroides stercoris TaxID=46506 RepID=UPI001C2D0B5C
LLRYLKKIFYNSVAELRINTAGDDAYELKKSLRNLIQKDSDPQLVKFVNSIDSVPEVETA